MPSSKLLTKEISSSRGYRRDITDRYSGSNFLESRDKILRQKGRGSLEIYDDLFADAQILSCWQQRASALKASETIVLPGGTRRIDKDAASFIEGQIKSIEWDRICSEMQYAVFNGYAVGEAVFKRGAKGLIELDSDRGGILARNPSRFRFDHDHNLRLLTWENQATGSLMPDRKFWIVSSGATNSDEPMGRGLGSTLWWLRYLKRNIYDFWMTHLEKYASPSVIIEYEPRLIKGEIGSPEHNAAVDELAKLATQILSESGSAVPEGMKVRLLEATRAGAAGYQESLDRIDAEIGKTILSQSMTTDNGSSLAQAQVHENVALDVFKSDADLICQSFTRSIVTWLVEWNFLGAAIPEVWRTVRPEPDLKAMAERDKILSIDMGQPLSPEYLIKTYGDIFALEEEATKEATNLNGEQTKSLMEIINAAKAGQWSPGLAESFIRSSYPTIPQSLIDALAADLAGTESAVSVQPTRKARSPRRSN